MLPKNPASAKFDFKKVYKDCYAPKPTPLRIFVPMLSFIVVQGAGNPITLSNIARNPTSGLGKVEKLRRFCILLALVQCVAVSLQFYFLIKCGFENKK